jgi:hypothetical protein
VHVGEHVTAAVLRIELRDRLDGAHPAGRVRRNLDGVLVILFDTSYGLAQAAMQVRVVSEVLANRLTDAHELAFEESFLRFAARGEQHFAVALRQPFLCMRERMCRDAQAVRQRTGDRADRQVRGAPREVHDPDQQDYPDDGRENRPWSDRKESVH